MRSLFILALLTVFTAIQAQDTQLLPPPAQAAANFMSARQQQIAFYKQFAFASEAQYDSLNRIMYGEGVKGGSTSGKGVQKSGSCTLNRQVYGWHPYWNGASVYENYDFSLLSTFSYFAYELNPSTGSYYDIHYWKTTNSITLAQEAGARVDLCVTNFGTTPNITFLGNQTAWHRFADSLIVLLNYRNADGVNIDFEGMPGSQRNNFTNFISYLRNRLNADRPSTTISIALYAVDWTNVFDITALNPLVDAFIVMGYDYHYSADSQAGPVSPLYHGTRWGTYTLSRTADTYLTQGVTPAKLLMGIPYYGYDWKTETTNIPAATIDNADTRTYSYLRNNFFGTYTRQWDLHSFSPYFSYTSGGNTRQCWFEDEQSLAARYDMVLNRQMGGIGIWALGYDNGYPELWNLIEEKFTDCHTYCSGNFNDSGGPQGNYRNNENSVFTLASPDPGGQITLSFTSFNTEANYDFVRIYDGANTSSPLLGTFSGNINPGTFTSSGNALTIRFTSDNATLAPGWEINWYCGCNHVTAIEPLETQYNNDFTAYFTETGNCNAGVKYGFYQTQQSWGGAWRSNNNIGFFNDDFTATALHPDWQSASGNWQITDGSVWQTDDSNSNTNLFTPVHQFGTEVWLFHWRAKAAGSDVYSRRAGMHFFASDGNATNRGNSYFAFARFDDDKAQIYKVTGNTFELMANADFDFAPNQWYDFKTIYNPVSGLIELYVNNALATSWTDPEPYLTGEYISLRTGNSKAYFDFVRVYRARSNQENISVGNSPTDEVNQTAHECRILSLSNYSDNKWSNLAQAETGIAFTVNTQETLLPDAQNNPAPTLLLYPNPAHDMVQVVFTAAAYGTAQLTLYDLAGRQVQQQPLGIIAGNNTFQVMLNQIPAGMYLLSIVDENGNATQQKLVVR